MSGLIARRNTLARCIALMALLGVLATFAQPATAQTSDSTGVSVTLVDEGVLNVAWAGDGTSFLDDGAEPALTSANPEVVATAVFVLDIGDTRADGARTGYQVSINATPFTTQSGGNSIPPSSISVVSVTGVSGEFLPVNALGASLENPVTIVSVPDDASLVNGTVSITLAMTLTPDLVGASYSGGIVSSVVPVSVDGP